MRPEDNLPEPFYECANESCAEDRTWPADMLKHYPATIIQDGSVVEAGFYCGFDECGWHRGEAWRIAERGSSLQEYLDAGIEPPSPPLFQCADWSCKQHYTWPAENLRWFIGWIDEDGERIEPGFYCHEAVCDWDTFWFKVDNPLSLFGNFLSEYLLAASAEESEGEEAHD